MRDGRRPRQRCTNDTGSEHFQGGYEPFSERSRGGDEAGLRDTVARHICRRCGNIHYVNPTVIVGCVAEAADGRILMCRRRISPRRGFWTFPAGFLECGESAGEGARREVLEETRAQVHIEGLLCVIDVPQMSEVHLVYRGTMRGAALAPTEESSEVVLMAEAEIPWDDLAFTSIGESLRHYFDDRRAQQKIVHTLDLRTAPPDENRDEVAESACRASGGRAQ